MSIEAAPESQQSTSNLRVSEFTPLPTPQEIVADLPLDTRLADVVARGRDEVRAIMDGVDDRLLVIVGPCSIHDPKAGLEYARRLVGQAGKHKEDLLIVMRAYFEKPRTTVGWKGLINDPRLDGSHDIAAGLRAEGEAVPALMGMLVKELQTLAALARASNLAAEFKAQRVWDAKQAIYKRALGKHPPERWQRFLAEAGRVDRIAKGRGRIGEESTDAWLQLERVLLAVADPKAGRLLVA